MRNIDFSSWQAGLTTLVGLLVATLLMVGIRLMVMQTIQRKRERENRQINERLRTLIAAYKTLGSSFTGELRVDPRHKRDMQASYAAHRADALSADEEEDLAPASRAAAWPDSLPEPIAERRRRTRDAVEAALSDIVLLGTEEQVRLAAAAARDMVAGRPVHLAALVLSLRSFIRGALDLDPIPADVIVPDQGPLRPSASGAGRRGNAGGEGARGGGGGGRGGAGDGGGSGAGLGVQLGRHDETR